ncbi:MAG TPA: 2OG-Fe(II) oxygenase [Burkholderiales bacterium]|nr:2OG-Fe(II) oxygenase [Burkholderiales bacterium]
MPDKRRPNPLTIGEPAPWFRCATRLNDDFVFDTVAGRYIVLCFLGSAGSGESREILDGIRAARSRFDDEHFAFFGVSREPSDMAHALYQDEIPGIRFFQDFDLGVSALYGALTAEGAPRNLTYVLSPNLRVMAVLGSPGSTQLASLMALLDRLPAPPPAFAALPQAPVLVVPWIFEPALCRDLIAYYERLGGEDSGFMRDVDDKTTKIIDYGHKRRRDREVTDEKLRRACMVRLHDRLGPEIEKAYQFRATRMERHIVACYEAADGGYFAPHRDNTTRGTAHRKFAVSLFLNAGEFEGGQLRFPEYGNAAYTAPTGGAVVFSCSMLHEATPVTKGKRYMFLPFLYDDAAANLRTENEKYLDPATMAGAKAGESESS